MVLTYDIGSFPYSGDFKRFMNGLKTAPLTRLLYTNKASDRRYFEDKIIECLIDKIIAGISVPNYPQFRDMNEMFLSSISGISKTKSGYKVVDNISIQERKFEIPEVVIIREKAKEVFEKTGLPLNIKICVTGPYTLASMFLDRESYLFVELGNIVSKFIKSNVFSDKFCRVSLISLDEPVFGLIDDPLIDYGYGGREELLKGWERIFYEIKSRGVHSIIHLHNTTNDFFWQADSLDIVESHIDDPLYSSPKTKEYLERYDKFLKASICITNFDVLIRNELTSNGITNELEINQRIAHIWTNIKKGRINPNTFLESTDIMSRRLGKIIGQYGDRILYAGPECGLKSFPTYNSAIECLRRVDRAAKVFGS